MAEKQIFPTRGNLIASKRSLTQSRLGYELMDRKRNILIREIVALSGKSKELRGVIEDSFSAAYSALQLSNIMLGVENPTVWQTPVENSISLSSRSIMGVEIPTVSIDEKKSAYTVPPYGALISNFQFDHAFVHFNRAKMLSAVLAEVENSIYRLALAIKKTQKRANALKNILIPMYENQVKFITSSLEEKEREEFSRQKVIKANKLKSESHKKE